MARSIDSGQPNNSLQRTRLRRVVTGRSLSQAFGLATVRVYHRRAAELNRSAVTSTSQGGLVNSGMPSKSVVPMVQKVFSSPSADCPSGEQPALGAHPAPILRPRLQQFRQRGVCLALAQGLLRPSPALLSRHRTARRARKAATLFLTNSVRRAERRAPLWPRSAGSRRRGPGTGFSRSKHVVSLRSGRGHSALRLTFCQRRKRLAFQGCGSITPGAAFKSEAAEQLVAADSGYAAGCTGRLDSQKFGLFSESDSRRRCR